MIKAGVFAQEEIDFGYVTDSPREAVDLIVRSLAPGRAGEAEAGTTAVPTVKSDTRRPKPE
jgi:hypothetical protein